MTATSQSLSDLTRSATPSADERKAATLRALLAPRSIAVIGASRRQDTNGYQILRNLIDFGFTGAVYPVNPRAVSVCSVPAYSRIEEIADPIDVAIIAVPAAQVVETAVQCGEAKVKGLVVISAGFREVGAEGAAREQQLVEVVRHYGMRMVGPNCMGIINLDPAVSMNGTFTTATPPAGHAAFVSQSGALGVSVLDSAREYGIGISQFVSVGNKPDVSGNDLLLEWENDPAIRIILMYVENFGNPTRFLEIASRITKTKPIVVVKSGRSRAGARAASSHTGALAASDAAVDALLAQAGVLRASTIEELFDIAMAFETRVLPRSRRTAVLTNSGRPGILAADALEGAGLNLVDLSERTIDALRPHLPPEASIRNPLDMIASATPTSYAAAMTALLGDPMIDTVVPIFVPPFGIRQEEVAEAIRTAAASRPDKAVLAVLMGREGLPQGRAELNAAGIPTYVFPESAARAAAALNRQVEWTRRAPSVAQRFEDVDAIKVRGLIEGARRDRREQLTQVEALALLQAYGISTAAVRVATTAEEAVSIANRIGYPVVMKLVSPDVIHKTEIGGVRVGLTSEAQVRAAHDEIIANAVAAIPTVHIGGVLVQPVVTGGVETIVGLARDPLFGPLVMFGLGGVFVEAMRDVVFRIAPVARDQAMEMIAGIRGVKLLDGMRGMPPANRDALTSVVCRLAQLAAEHADILEIDVNPLLARPADVVALDARARIRL